MTNRVKTVLALAVVLGAASPLMAAKTTTVVGRVIEVQEERRFPSGPGDEVSQTLVVRTARGDLSVGLSSQTHYLRWITRQPWQQSTRADASFLKPGRLVAVHFSEADEHPIARLVRIATE